MKNLYTTSLFRTTSRYFGLFGLMLIVFACSKPAAVPPLSDRGVILAFGDSLTYGTGVGNGDDYPAILSRLTAREVINEGIPGEISSAGLARLPGLLDEYRPELLILIHGGNDMLRNIPATQTRANIEAMIELAHERDIAVVMLGVPEPRLFLLSSADFYGAVAEKAQIPIDLDLLPDILADNDLKSDMIHLNKQGYRRMAESLHALLLEGGAL
jgi:acyl-CoA thioesterase I